MFGILAMNVGNEDAVTVLDFIVKTIVKVCYPPFRLAQTRGGIVIFVDDFFNKDGEAPSAASRTLRRTSRHPDLLCLPVDLGVVLAKPGEAEDHALFA